MSSLIAELEEQVEHWRQRAEAAEAILRGNDWDMKVYPLTLYQTRIVRLLSRADFSTPALIVAMAWDYPDTTADAIKVHICQIRKKLPARIAPTSDRGWNVVYRVPDRAALRDWLNAGLRVERRAA